MPVVGSDFLPSSECLQLVISIGNDRVRESPFQHIRCHNKTNLLIAALYCRQSFLHDNRAIKYLRRIPAYVTVATMAFVRLAKVVQ